MVQRIGQRVSTAQGARSNRARGSRIDSVLLPRHTKQYILDRIEVDEYGCWIWQRSFHGGGYGQLGVKPYSAHVLAYTLWRQKPWLQVRHLCHNPACCNPWHLVEGSALDNYNDSGNVHLAAAVKRRGRSSPNRKPVVRDGIWYESTAAYALSRKGIRGRPPNVAHGGGKQGIRKCKCDLCLERRRIYMRELRASAERERMPDHAYQTRA